MISQDTFWMTGHLYNLQYTDNGPRAARHRSKTFWIVQKQSKLAEIVMDLSRQATTH